MRYRKICIVGLDAYGLLSGEGDLKYIGGETVQHVLLARAWRDLGYDVSIIVFDDGQGARRVVDGITAIAAQSRNGGLPGLKFFHPRASKLFSALAAADADVYYQSPAGAFTGITAWFCRMTGRKFIFRVASDSDCEKEHSRIKLWRDRKLYEYGLRHADLVAVQTGFQADMLRENHGLESSVVNMLVEPPRRGTSQVKKDIDVLWMGNLRTLKRPEMVLELARQLPDVRFTLAGGPCPFPWGYTYFDDVKAAAARLPNVSMPGAVRYTESGEWFDRARIFLNTSSIEGFPNTFLQAWVRGVPVVSFFDPDGLIRRLQLGQVATTLDDMREFIRGLLDVDVYRENIGRRARDFVSREFTTAAAARYLELLETRPVRVRVGAADGGTVP
ncbi:MAG TPA: glycosyltransferase family 4 protein [Steroidobacteraceae bacterium]|jgi:glycosyltransferase involved in cell wall biosynthesis|nr:glycosyltransferase family 4 protein [Steroidobacteraceae bacterium]